MDKNKQCYLFVYTSHSREDFRQLTVHYDRECLGTIQSQFVQPVQNVSSGRKGPSSWGAMYMLLDAQEEDFHQQRLGMFEYQSLSRVRLFATTWAVHEILQTRILEWIAIPEILGKRSKNLDQKQIFLIFKSCVTFKFYSCKSHGTLHPLLIDVICSCFLSSRYQACCIGFRGEGNGNPLQYSCLENPRDRGAQWAAVYGVAQSWTRLKRLSSSSSIGFRCGCLFDSVA